MFMFCRMPHFFVMRGDAGDDNIVIAGIIAAIGTLLKDGVNTDVHIYGTGSRKHIRGKDDTFVNLFIQTEIKGVGAALTQLLQVAFHVGHKIRLGLCLLGNSALQPFDKSGETTLVVG